MKKLIYILVPALSISIVSCNKKEDPTPTTPVTTTPTTPTPPSPNVPGVYGAFVSLVMTYSTTQVGIPVDLNTEIGIAAAYQDPWSAAGTNTMIDAGTVKVNNNTLDKGTNNAYTKTATAGQTPSDLGFSSGVSWTVSGNANFPAVTRNLTNYAPDFTGTVPETVSRTSDLTLSFTASTTPHADSVYVLLITGNTTIMKRYAATIGTVTIPASELSALSATSTTSPGYIEICPWNVQYYTEGMSKTCAYVRERAIVKSITVN
ncbi:MAG: hypothetical protein JSS82_06080 [Bacteroidetes bacterium]|nr:hypothetical protein [Bacteroidota bacterium]